MSLDIFFTKPLPESCLSCENCNEVKKSLEQEEVNLNVTHNLNKMAMEAGFYEAMWRPKECDLERAEDVLPHLEKGLAELLSKPEHYKKFNPENGWGTYEGLVDFTERYIQACKSFPKHFVGAWR